MKLKQVVSSLVLLGLSSGVAFAADADTQAQLDSMKSQIAKMEATMNQNQPGGFQQANDWFNRVTISGQANLVGAWANRSPVLFNTANVSGSQNGSASDLYLQNANIYIDAKASDWTTAHVGLVYGSDNKDFVRVQPGYVNGSYNVVDEAYVTIGNFAKSPFYFKAGKQRVLFGDYQPYADILPSVTQLMSETTATAATVGFVDANGFNAAVYAFRGMGKDNGDSTAGLSRVKNYGAAVGFANAYNGFGYKVGAQYIRNLADVNYISQTAEGGTDGKATLYSTGYTRQVGGLALNAGMNYGAFDLSGKYVTALQNFNANDVMYTTNGGRTVKGAKPAAWSFDGGYAFPVMGHSSRVNLGYQGTKEASGLGAYSGYNAGTGAVPALGYGLPKTRYTAGYNVNVSKFTDVGFAVYNDHGYSVSKGGTGKNATTGALRLAVKFA